MKKFMDKNFLLETKTAQKLYHDFAKNKMIYDYHCHLSPKEIYEDKQYSNITEIWLAGDHYKWRFMRSMGTEERCCTGDATDFEKFMAYAKAVQYAIGNPLYHWTHLELQRYFGIDEYLTEKNAEKIWNEANAQISEGGFSARELIKKSNVALIATTDDPTDTLEYHQKLAEDKNFTTRVVPTYRPDNVLGIEKDTFAQYIVKLEDSTGVEVKDIESLKKALVITLDKFESVGCKISDHSASAMPFIVADEKEVNAIYKKALKGKAVTEKEAEIYKTAIMLFLGKEYAKRNWAMQLHLSPLRNNNTRMFEKLGADVGFDSIDDPIQAKTLSSFLNELDKEDLLPKTILYTLNPKDNFVLGTMLGNFQTGGVKGKIQFGSAWWFNDHRDGMEEQMKALANLGALSAFVGMLTDSRSFTSYPRHEYFRRILCNILGTWVENGEFPEDYDLLGKIVEGISYDNAASYFGIEL
ncbi:MAG: glucuronate isomerase [Clostridia bacterium]|nr:glucuronate isomerase [Clostridia bacterium]